MKVALKYSLRVWMLGWLSSPVLLMIIDALVSNASLFNPFFLIYGLFMGFYYSLPAVLPLWIILYQVNKRNLQGIYRQLALASAGLVLGALLLLITYLYNEKFMIEATCFSVAYGILIGCGMLYYKLEPAGEPDPNDFFEFQSQSTLNNERLQVHAIYDYYRRYLRY